MSLSIPSRRLLLAPRRDLVRDTFTRADDATTLGRTETGQAWTIDAGQGTFGVAGGLAYLVTAAGRNAAYITSGRISYTFTCDIQLNSGEGSIVLRWQDSNNFFYCRLASNAFELIRLTAGASTTLATVAVTPSTTIFNKVKIVLVANRFLCYLNDVLRLDVTDTQGAAVTTVGITGGPVLNGPRWDNFAVKL